MAKKSRALRSDIGVPRAKCEPGCKCGKHNRTDMIGNKRGLGNPAATGLVGELNPNWKGDDVKPESLLARGRKEARRLYPLDGVICEWCNRRPAEHRHHINGDTDNNKRSNIALLCQTCHGKDYLVIQKKSEALKGKPWSEARRAAHEIAEGR